MKKNLLKRLFSTQPTRFYYNYPNPLSLIDIIYVYTQISFYLFIGKMCWLCGNTPISAPFQNVPMRLSK